MKATQTVEIEIEDLEITAHMTCTVTATDYGVDRSPAIYEYDEINAETIEINGEEYTEAEVVSKFGKDVMPNVYDAVEDDRWDHGDFGDDDCDREFDE